MIRRAVRFAIAGVGMALVAVLPALRPALASAQDAHDATQGATGAATLSDAPATVSAAATDEESALHLLSIVLQLSDSQQQQARVAFDAAAKTAAPMVSQMENDKKALFAAVLSDKTDEDEIKHLAELQGSLTSQMLILQAQTFAKLWAILEEPQRARVDDFVYSNIRLFLPAFPE